MAVKKIKKCQICQTSFEGRRDAKTCSAACRKRLQRAISRNQSPPKKKTGVESAIAREIHRISSGLLKKHVLCMPLAISDERGSIPVVPVPVENKNLVPKPDVRPVGAIYKPEPQPQVNTEVSLAQSGAQVVDTVTRPPEEGSDGSLSAEAARTVSDTYKTTTVRNIWGDTVSKFKHRQVVLVALVFLLLFPLGGILLMNLHGNGGNGDGGNGDGGNGSGGPFSSSGGISGTDLNKRDKFSVNLTLEAKNTLIVAPTSKPKNLEKGQIYLDQSSDKLLFYDGEKLHDLGATSSIVNNIQGPNNITNSTIINSTIQSGVSKLNGTTNQINVSSGTGNVTLSLPQDIGTGSTPTFSGLNLGSALQVASGGTGTSNFTTNSLLLGNGSGAIQTTNVGSTGDCLIVNGSGVPTFQSCAGGGGVFAGGSQTPGTLTKFDTTTNQIVDSLVSESGSVVTIGGDLSISGIISGDGSGITALDAGNISSGVLSDSRLSGNVTLQGNTFNGASQLVQLTGGGLLPVLDGSNLTNVDALTLQGNGASYFTDAGNISSGTLSDLRLSANVALLGNDNNFTGANLQHNGNDICDDSNNCNYASSSGSGNYIQNGTTAQTADFNITGDGTVGGTLAADTVNATTSFELNGTDINTGGTLSNVAYLDQDQTLIGHNIFKNSSDSTTAFQIQNLAGTSNLFVADTVNNRIGIGTLGPGYSLDVQSGDINTTGLYRVNGSQISSANLSNDTNLAKINGANVFTAANTFSGTVAIQGANSLTLGTASNLGSIIFRDGTSANTATLQVSGALSGDVTFGLPVTTGTQTICTIEAGNCAGSGSGVTTSGGTPGRLAVFTGSQALGDSSITDDGLTVTVTVGQVIQGSAGLTIGDTGVNGQLVFKNGSNSNTLTLQSGVTTGNLTFTLPTGDGSNGDCLQTNGSGVLAFSACTGGAGGGVTSVNTLTGVLNLVGTANQVDVSSAGDTLTLSLPQDINTSGNANFRTITLTGQAAGDNLIVGNAVSGATGSLLDLKVNNVSKVTVDASGNVNTTGQYQVNGSQISSADLSNDSNLAKLDGTGPQVFTGDNEFTGTVLTQLDSPTAFQIQNGAGTSDLFVADTTTTRIGIGTATPGYTLDVNGDINTSGVYRINGVTVCSASGCTAASGSGDYIQNGTIAQTADFNITGTGVIGGILTAGAGGKTAVTISDSGAQDSGITIGGDTNLYRESAGVLSTDNTLNVYDGAYVQGGSNGTLTLYNGNESTNQTDFTQALNKSAINIVTDFTDGAYTPGIVWSTQDNNSTKPKAGIYLKEDGSAGTSLLFGTSDTYTTGITNDALTLGPKGDAVFKNGSNSSTGFQVQNATGTGLFTVNTSTGATLTSTLFIDTLGSGGTTAVCWNGSSQISTCASTGSIGFWNRTGTTLSPATAGDAITTSGNISTTGSGTLSVAGTSTLTGNVGIGQASTSNKLDVNGDINVTSGNYYRQAGSIVVNTNTGTRNTFLGVSAGNTSASGNDNSAVGYQALQSISSGIWNTAFGSGALTATSTGTGNTALGRDALNANTANGSTAVGDQALTKNTTGNQNTAIGELSLNSNTSGSGNTAVGYGTGVGSTGLSDITGNVLLGYQAGTGLRTGADYNTLLGYNAGSSLTTGANNILIGNGIQAASATGNYQLNIGGSIIGDLSAGQIAIGSSSLPANGVLTIGTNTASASGGLYFGTDTDLYRYDVNELRTGGAFDADGNIIANYPLSTQVVIGSVAGNAGIYFGSANDTSLFRSSTSELTTNGDLVVQGGDLTTNQTTFNLLAGATTALNIGPGSNTAVSINLAGGAGATGCTIAGATGNLTCDGAIATNATTGTQGWWTRSGTTLSPVNSGDAITTSGNISTSGSGAITAAGTLTANGQSVVIQPSSSLTAGQTNISQTLTNASSSGGTVNGYNQAFTISNSGSGSTTNGLNISLADNAAGSPGNIDRGINISLSGSNSSRAEVGLLSTVTRGIALQAISSGFLGNGSVTCNGVNVGLGLCAGDSAGSNGGAGIYGYSGSRATSNIYDVEGSGVYGITQGSGAAGAFYGGIKGIANQSANNAYTSMGVYGKGKGGTSATVYGGYFTLDSGSTATAGAALFASNSSTTANILQLQDNTTDVFTVADGGNVTAAGDIAINGGDLTTTATTFNLLAGAGTALNIGPASTTAVSINLAGGSSDTGCTVAGATGNLTCSGNLISGSNQAFVQNGNSMGATAVLGTNDSNSLAFETNNVTKWLINTTGDFLPNLNDTYNIGSDTARVANLYLGGETLHIGSSTSDESTISYNNTLDSLILKNATNSTTAFQVQDKDGNSLLTGDTSNKKINVAGDLNVGSRYGNRIFSDNFESGGLNLWDQGNGGAISIDTTTVHSGKYSAKVNPAGAAAYADATISANTTTYMRAWVNVTSQTSGNADIMTLYYDATHYWTLYRNSGAVHIYNGVLNTDAGSGGSFTASTWHLLEMRVTTGAGTGTTQAWLDGTLVVNATSQNNGTNNPEIIEIGDSNSRTFTAYMDDVAVDTATTGTASSLNVDDSLHVGGTGAFGGPVLIQSTSTAPDLSIQAATGNGATARINADDNNVAALQLMETNDRGFNLFYDGNPNQFVIQANDAGTLSDVVSIQRTDGSVLFQNSADSTTAFQVQDQNDNPILYVDTTNAAVRIKGTGANGGGGRLQFGDGDLTGSQNAWVGEHGTGDSDQLQLQGANGVYITGQYDGSVEIANFFSDTTGIYGTGVNALAVAQFNSRAVFGYDGSTQNAIIQGNSGKGFRLYTDGNDSTTRSTFSVDTDGAALFQNYNNTNTAFDIQDSSGTSLFGADSSNKVINLGGGAITPPNGGGTVGTWSNTTALGTGCGSGVYGAASVAYNGYIYIIGGSTGGTTATATVCYATLNGGTGAVGTWTSTTNLPANIYNATSVVYNGYVYVIGGSNGTTDQTTVYYAPLNSNGTVGTWNTTTALSTAVQLSTSVVSNGYVYLMGGSNSGTLQTTVSSAKINSNGTIGSWSTTTSLPAARAGAASVINNGYVYEIGGNSSGATCSGTNTSTVYYAPVYSNGVIGNWNTTTSLTNGRFGAPAVTWGGYLYGLVGNGAGGGCSVASVTNQPFPINSNGTIGSQGSLNSPTTGVFQSPGVVYNGYAYILGGTTDGTTATTAVQFASLSGSQGADRSNTNLSINGGLLTTNANIVGALQVQGTFSLTDNSATTTNLASISGTSLTSGSALQITGPSGASAVSNGIFRIAASGAYTGTGGLINISASGTTSGTLATITNTASSQTTSTLLNVVQSNTTTGYTGNIINFQGSSTSGAGNLLNLNFASNTGGAALNISGGTGAAIRIANGNIVDLASGTNGNTTILRIPQKATNGTCASAGNEGLKLQTTGGTQVGHICIDGPTSATANKLRFYAESFTTAATDVAENYTDTNNDLSAGDLVALAADGSVKSVVKATIDNSSQLLGVVSTNPGILLSDIAEDGSHSIYNPKPIALTGRIPTKVSTENGPISTGDYLTISSTPGVAMKANGAGTVIGRALESYSSDGTGTILVFAQTQYYAGPTEGSFIQDGSSAALSDLTVSGLANLTNINVSNTAIINNLSVNGTTTLATLHVTGTAQFNGPTISFSDNVRGINQPIDNAASTKDIIFGTPYPDTNYAVQCTPSYNTNCYITDKKTTGFTINFGTVPNNNNQTVDWFVTR